MKKGRKIWKWGIRIIIILFSFFLIAWGAIQLPGVQTFIVHKTGNFLSKKLQTKVSVGRVELAFIKTGVFRDVFLADRQGDTLLFCKTLKVDVDLFSFFQKKIHLRKIYLEEPKIHLAVYPETDTFNFQFLLDAFAKTDSSKSKKTGWEFKLSQLSIRDWLFSLKQNELEIKTDVQILDIGLKHLDLSANRIALNRLALKNSEVALTSFKKTIIAPSAQKLEKEKALSFPFFGWNITAREILLENNAFKYDDWNYPVSKEGLDYRHLDLQNATLRLTGFHWKEEAIELAISQIQFRDRNGFQLNQFRSEIGLYPQAVELNDLFVQTPQSRLQNSTKLSFASFASLKNFLSEVKVESQFGQSLLSMADVESLVPNFKNIPNVHTQYLKQIQLEGAFVLQEKTAKVSRLKMQLSPAFALSAEGSVGDFTGAGDVHLQIHRLSSSYKNLNRLLKDVATPEGLEDLGQFDLKVKLDGTFDELLATGLHLKTASPNTFQGDVLVKNLSNSEKLIFESKIENLSLTRSFLEGIASQKLPKQLDSIDLIHFSGDLKGDLAYFDVDGFFQTPAGDIEGKIRMDFEADYRSAAYHGDLQLQEINLPVFLGSSSNLGKANVAIQFDGQGFSPEEIEASWKIDLQSLDFKDYRFQGLIFSGKMAEEQVDASMKMTEENLAFNLQSHFHLADSASAIQLDLKIDTLNFEPLGLTDRKLGLSGKLNVDFQGTKPDQINGKALATQFLLSDSTEWFQSDSFLIELPPPEPNFRRAAIQSHFLNAHLEGDYQFADLPEVLSRFANAYFPFTRSLTNDSLGVEADSLALGLKKDQNFEFALTLSEGADVLGKIIAPGLEKLDSASLTAYFDGLTNHLAAEGFLPQIQYKNYLLDSLAFSAQSDSSNLSTHFVFSSFTVADNPVIPFTSLSGLFSADKLTYKLNIKENPYFQKFQLGGTALVTDSAYQIALEEDFLLNNETWKIDPANELLFGKGKLAVSNLIFTRKEQKIAVFSQTREESAPLEIILTRFRLQEISNLINQPNLSLAGLIDGQIQLFDYFDQPYFKGGLEVKHLAFNDQELGNLKLDVRQLSDQSLLDGRVKFSGENNDWALTGQYSPADRQFSNRIQIDRLAFSLLEPFLSASLSDAKGFFSGELELNGSLDKPLLTGALQLNELGAKLHISNTEYRLSNSQIRFLPDKIDLGTLTVNGSMGRSAKLTGFIGHRFLRNYSFNLNFDSDAFQVLNTKKSDNDLYYGNLLVKTSGSIKGPLEKFKIELNTRTLPGSELFVVSPTAEPQMIQEDFIIFGNPYRLEQEGQIAQKEKKAANAYDFELRANLEISKDLKMHILIDPGSGDQLDFSGSANLSFYLNPRGDYKLIGNYVFETGTYAFSYEGLVKKKFQIRKGSSLLFSGNPFDARFDIAASYQVKTSTYELIGSQSTMDAKEKEEAMRPTDVNVLMKIQGDLKEPVLGFDIEIPRSAEGSIKTALNRKLTQLQENPNELNKQVFGLLFFNSFISSSGSNQTISAAAETAAFSSLRGFASSQLNRLANKYVKGVEISFDMDSYQAELENPGSSSLVTEMEVKVSKQLFKDRLSLEVGGNVNMVRDEITSFDNTNFSTIAGDFVLEYKLNKKGNYLLRVFHLNDYDLLTDENNYKTGLSFVIRKPIKRKKK